MFDCLVKQNFHHTESVLLALWSQDWTKRRMFKKLKKLGLTYELIIQEIPGFLELSVSLLWW